MKYYCIGIKGAGMSTLANILHDLGHSVIGYDDVEDFKYTEEGLKKRNIKIYYGHDHVIDEDTIVTYSKAFSEDHPEILRVKELGLTIKKYNEILGDLTKMFETISVSGTHGKTTTSSLIAHVLSNTIGCNYFIGDGSGFADKKNKLFVIESDEFNKHFLAYRPTFSVITNIEEEHMECYKDLNDIIDTFNKFCDNTSKNIIACGDNANVRKLKTNNNIRYYGFNLDNDTIAKNIILDESGASFDVYRDNQFFEHFNLPLYGKHMVLNALACIEICLLLNIDSKTIKNLLGTFKNAKRRLAIETVKDTVIVDDYAHHPTEISVTIDSLRQKYPDKKIVAIFKPNTYSRMKDFEEDFVSSLAKADKTFITPIDSNREKQSDYPNVCSDNIVNKINKAEIIDENTVNKLCEYKDAVILFMSCASISHLKEKLISLL